MASRKNNPPVSTAAANPTIQVHPSWVQADDDPPPDEAATSARTRRQRALGVSIPPPARMPTALTVQVQDEWIDDRPAKKKRPPPLPPPPTAAAAPPRGRLPPPLPREETPSVRPRRSKRPTKG